MKPLRAGKVQYDFVEIMACPGGCAGGGGQPIHPAQELAGMRGDMLYGLDTVNRLRFSHENPSVQALYRDYLGCAAVPVGAQTAPHGPHGVGDAAGF